MSEIKYYYDMQQGTEEWLNIRLGLLTASNINKLITPTGKISKAKSVTEYAMELAIQREARFLEDTYQSFDMLRGQIQEIKARDYYNDFVNPVKECGFVTRKFNNFTLGASPDGLVNDNGGIEIKSRLSKFQIKTIIMDEVPNDYINQIQACMLASDRDWWDFVQYSNGLPLYIKRVLPDLERQDLIIEAGINLEKQIVLFQEQYREKALKLIQTERVDFSMDDIILTNEG